MLWNGQVKALIKNLWDYLQTVVQKHRSIKLFMISAIIEAVIAAKGVEYL